MPLSFVDLLVGYPLHTNEILYSYKSTVRAEAQVTAGVMDLEDITLVAGLSARTINSFDYIGAGGVDYLYFRGARLELGVGGRWTEAYRWGDQWTEAMGTVHAGLVDPAPSLWVPQGNWGFGAQARTGLSFGDGRLRPTLAAELALWVSGASARMEIATVTGGAVAPEHWSLSPVGARAAVLAGVEWSRPPAAAPPPETPI